MDVEKEYFEGTVSTDNGTEVGISCKMDLTYFDGIVYVPVLIQSEEAAYDYNEDFDKICSSLKPFEDNQDNAGYDQE